MDLKRVCAFGWNIVSNCDNQLTLMADAEDKGSVKNNQN